MQITTTTKIWLLTLLVRVGMHFGVDLRGYMGWWTLRERSGIQGFHIIYANMQIFTYIRIHIYKRRHWLLTNLENIHISSWDNAFKQRENEILKKKFMQQRVPLQPNRRGKLGNLWICTLRVNKKFHAAVDCALISEYKLSACFNK